ncbi:MAG: hypothetical protein E6R03_11550 [Hyphomicrobiaceae bacterium]|nr:MAG: hypothetical protein E6R03_11550 [Hyphomicrobiaceae bacterium]
MSINTTDLTQATLEGNGIFDVLMKANKAHLESEFQKGRIKGPEYSTVYLGSLTQVMQTALQFLLSKEKTGLENLVLEKQIALADAQTREVEARILQIQKQTELVEQQRLNAVTENTVLVAQECKLRAEYDLTMGTVLKAAQETALLSQKTATERAQITALGVDEDSVVGRQKGLYVAQTAGFTRDAEQKAAKLLVDSWNVRRTTDEGTVADGTNMLNDATIGRAVTKLLAGVNA